ncbi:hypothetical protein C1645_783353 [Glomus cerebriforme]|uniref:Uncharacterized protein n=1 Tax=Glomus cerebriforme TaxID=658196 RepID=A0A397SL10_9GLOM|nr:hypothetical protein C1645_783353 [Glomus cerebriforme]
MKLRTKLGWCAYICVILIFCLYAFAILSLEIAKIALFNQTNGELKVHIIDYIYLAQLICGLLYSCCCSCCDTRETRYNSYTNGSATTLTTTIFILYMCLTIHEMGDIPFFCPADYPYTSPLIRTACQVRAANLLLIWILAGLSVITILTVCVIFIVFSLTTKKSDAIDNV